jgi:hypothetical protein
MHSTVKNNNQWLISKIKLSMFQTSKKLLFSKQNISNFGLAKNEKQFLAKRYTTKKNFTKTYSEKKRLPVLLIFWSKFFY